MAMLSSLICYPVRLSWSEPKEPEVFAAISQYKAEAVAIVLETGRPITEVAADLGINAGTLGNWLTAWHEENLEPEKASTPTERAGVAEMEAELRKLRLENEVLKKAASFFAKTQPKLSAARSSSKRRLTTKIA